MRAGEEYSELADLGSSYLGSGRYVGGPSNASWSRTPGGANSAGRSRSNTMPAAAEAEDVLDPNGTPRGHARSRSGLYYSPPGTSYTIIERPSSVMHHHSSREYNAGSYNAGLTSPRGELKC